MNRNGFTLLELIIYLTVIGLVLSGIVSFFFNVVYARVGVSVAQDVHTAGRLVAERLIYEIRNASAINSVSGSTLSLASADSSRNPTLFDLSGGQVRIGFGNSGSCPSGSPCPLTTNLVEATDLSFTDLAAGGSQQVAFSLTLQHTNTAGRPDNYDQTFSGSAELRSH